MHLRWKVGQLIHRGDLDTAAEYARLAYSRTYCESTADTCDTIIGAMCEAKRYRDAFDLFHYFYNEMKMGSTYYHSPSYITKALCEIGRVDDAIVFWRATSSQSCPYVIIKGLVEEGRLEEAVCLVREHSVPPLAWSKLISGFLNIGNVHMANQILEEFESNSDCVSKSESQAPLVRVVPFIEHCFNQGRDEEAMRCYQSFMCNKEIVNVCGELGKELLKLLLNHGKKTEAWNLFHRMLDGFKVVLAEFFSSSKNVDSETIDIMVGECFKEGVETLYKVKAKGGSLKPVNYRNVILCCCEQGMLSEAECLVAEYLDTPIYRAMMKAYVKAGRVDDALQMANKMVDGDLRKFALDMLN